MRELPIISVLMITYMHEEYLTQAIEGVLNQEGEFKLELIISDDNSPDNSQDLINKIKINHKNGNCVKYFKQEFNLGIMPNFYFGLQQCNGEFIAICEGDDYWIDNRKIQKQLNFLKKNPNHGLVYTNVKKLLQNNGSFVEEPPRYYSSEEKVQKMLESKYIEFATTMFKSKLLKDIAHDLENEMYNKIIGDTRILLEVAHRAEIGYLNEITTVYRINSGSATQSINIDKFIVALNDSYQCRKSFVERYNYPKKWLSLSLSNTVKNLINKAFETKSYFHGIRILWQIPFFDLLCYAKWNDIKQKNSYKQFVKIVLTILNLKR